MKRRIYISGMHSGQNPCSGGGIAKSLRQAFPDMELIGVDHWQGSSGLHHEAINDVLILPQWNQIDNDRHASFIRGLLDEGHIWISAIDIEVYWLAQYFGTHKNLLVPTGSALELTAKPGVKAMEGLGFRVPEYISAFSSDSDVHTFLRQNSWQCWLKGPYHDAKRITSWEIFERHRESMQKDWKTSRLFLQKHMIGNEESVCFSAFHGQLLAAVHMQKRLMTPEGKTWAGRVTPVSPQFFEKLKAVIQKLNWSGGGELEYCRDLDGNKWIIECNPRFPAWIYGAALAGVNLPAKMISQACGLPMKEVAVRNPFFTRVVQEIPVNEAVGLPLPPDPSTTAWSIDGSKGKGGPGYVSTMPRLRDKMTGNLKDEPEDQPVDVPFSIPADYSREIEIKAKNYKGETPVRIHLDEWTLSCFQSLVEQIKSAHRSPEIRIGYSVKTSATEAHLKHARKFGFLIECISQLEIRRALNLGVPASEIILNGPGKFWPSTQPCVTGLRILFCDSIEEFERVVQIPNIAKVLGFRVQLPKLQSRFGIAVDKIENFQRIVSNVRKMKNKAQLGFHFHMPSWAIGVQRWKEAIRSLLTWCQAVEQLTGTSVKHLDLGGGFFPSDLERINFRWLQETVNQALPQVEAIYFEPGRSLTQEGEVVFSRVLDIRRTEDNEVSELVVDACIAELPLIQSYAHRVFFQSQAEPGFKRFTHLKKGATKVLGRICMENDVLSRGLNVPKNVQLGDLIIFGDAGAYERSMSYDFGRG